MTLIVAVVDEPEKAERGDRDEHGGDEAKSKDLIHGIPNHANDRAGHEQETEDRSGEDDAVEKDRRDEAVTRRRCLLLSFPNVFEPFADVRFSGFFAHGVWGPEGILFHARLGARPEVGRVRGILSRRGLLAAGRGPRSSGAPLVLPPRIWQIADDLSAP
jgi:hypothetical protein